MEEVIANFKRRKKEPNHKDKELQKKDTPWKQNQEEINDDSTTVREEDNSQDNDGSQPLLDGDKMQQEEASPMTATADIRKILEGSQCEKK